jgi:TldD protein
MSNTFISPGKSSFEDLIKDIDLGVYLCGGEYGYVFCERGQYTCHAGEAYMIRNGQVAEHLRDVSVAGLTLETLMNIDAVGSDFEMKMPGMCGKDGQGMHVDNGGPHVRVKELVVGGRV